MFLKLITAIINHYLNINKSNDHFGYNLAALIAILIIKFIGGKIHLKLWEITSSYGMLKVFPFNNILNNTLHSAVCSFITCTHNFSASLKIGTQQNNNLLYAGTVRSPITCAANTTASTTAMSEPKNNRLLTILTVHTLLEWIYIVIFKYLS